LRNSALFVLSKCSLQLSQNHKSSPILSWKNSYFFLRLSFKKKIEDCPNLHSEPEMGGANGMHGRESHMYKILVGEPARKKKKTWKSWI
jgi:hypothetical protein